jgi:hypothetical protein
LCEVAVHKAGFSEAPARGHAFGPEEIKILTSAFEDALRTLGLVDRKSPAAQIVAKLTFDLARLGELDPIRLRYYAVEMDKPISKGREGEQLCPMLKPKLEEHLTAWSG